MASAYLRWLHRNEQPEQPLVLTPAQKRKNWWDYHKWHVVLGAAMLAIAGSVLWDASGIGKPVPDYQVAYVGANALPEDTAAALEQGFAALGEDLNGDGKVLVRLNQYTSSNEDASVAAAAATSLMGDILECESYFFLLENPERFQEDYHALRRLDGSLPPEASRSAEGTFLSWKQCPVLEGFALGDYSYRFMDRTVTGSSQALASQLYLARRGFWTEKAAAYPDGCDRLWDRLTEGAPA